MKLVEYVASITGRKEGTENGTFEVSAEGTPSYRVLQSQLGRSGTQLGGILDAKWREYLAIPADAIDSQRVPSEQALADSLARYDTIAKSPNYANLAKRPEFQTTHELLRELTAAVAASRREPIVSLPPPPTAVAPSNRR